METRGNSKLLLIVAGLIVCLVAGAFFSLTVSRGELNQDEGWYLYGARLIAEGQKPYIDFATTQGPVMQYVYSFFWPLIARFGILGGRVITALFGAAAVLLSAVTVSRLLKPGKRAFGVLVLLCLAGLNVYQLLFFSIVKTYALAAFFISLSLLLLTFGGRGKHLTAFFAGAAMMLAAGTRMSAGAIAPAVVVGLFVHARRERHLKDDLRWLAYGLGAAVCLVAIFGPFMAKAPEAVKFAMFDYHAGREGGGSWLAHRAGFVSRVVRAYYPALLALCAVLAYGCLSGKESGRRPSPEAAGFGWICLTGVLLATGLHFLAPFPYDDYQVMLLPALCVGIVAAGEGLIPERGQAKLGLGVVLACLLFAGASPVNEQMFVGKRDRIWWPMREETSLQKLARAAKLIKSRAGDSRQLLTQDLYIAVEADMTVPAGFELGPFSFFPDWSHERATACRVVNDEMIREIISASPANVAALSGYSFAIRAPAVMPYQGRADLLQLLESKFAPIEKISDFGQAETELTVYTRKKE